MEIPEESIAAKRSDAPDAAMNIDSQVAPAGSGEAVEVPSALREALSRVESAKASTENARARLEAAQTEATECEREIAALEAAITDHDRNLASGSGDIPEQETNTEKRLAWARRKVRLAAARVKLRSEELSARHQELMARKRELAQAWAKWCAQGQSAALDEYQRAALKLCEIWARGASWSEVIHGLALPTKSMPVLVVGNADFTGRNDLLLIDTRYNGPADPSTSNFLSGLRTQILAAMRGDGVESEVSFLRENSKGG